MRGSFAFVEPRAETGTYPGRVVAGVPAICASGCASFESLLAFRMVPFNVGERRAHRADLRPAGLGQLFLGARPAAGCRPLLPSGRGARGPATEPVVVISHGFWQARFGGAAGGARADPSRQRSRADDRRRRARALPGHGARPRFSIWVPATLAPALLAGSRELEDRAMRGYAVMGRLRAGATLAQAQAERRAA